MFRTATDFLIQWLETPGRKPLIIRGARQVGKTWLVRNLAQAQKRCLIEINFEKQPELSSLFAPNDPQQILQNLSALFGVIAPQQAILFLDEIQAAPLLLAKLRWFAEDLPELPVLAAGSLLEFVLAEHSFSMPVGRISYLYLEPMSFKEFLWAKQAESLVTYLEQYQWELTVPAAIHATLSALFKEYLLVGGLPQAVQSWCTQGVLPAVSQIQQDLLTTYRDDFNRYHGRLDTQRLDEILRAVPFLLGQKFMYSRVNSAVQATAVKQALELLCQARLCHRVWGSAGNGVPLAAELQAKYLKVILLDVGLCSALLGLTLERLQLATLVMINKGGLMEQVVGQMLRVLAPLYSDPALYYWHRDTQGASAEVDYLLQHADQVVPIEVKAGSTGSLKSLHLFMQAKQLTQAVRINADLPSRMTVQVKDQAGRPIQYQLLSLPYYLVPELTRLLA